MKSASRQIVYFSIKTNSLIDIFSKFIEPLNSNLQEVMDTIQKEKDEAKEAAAKAKENKGDLEAPLNN